LHSLEKHSGFLRLRNSNNRIKLLLWKIDKSAFLQILYHCSQPAACLQSNLSCSER